MESVHFWTEASESFIAPAYCEAEAIKLSGRVISIHAILLLSESLLYE